MALAPTMHAAVLEDIKGEIKRGSSSVKRTPPSQSVLAPQESRNALKVFQRSLCILIFRCYFLPPFFLFKAICTQENSLNNRLALFITWACGLIFSFKYPHILDIKTSSLMEEKSWKTIENKIVLRFGFVNM